MMSWCSTMCFMAGPSNKTCHPAMRPLCGGQLIFKERFNRSFLYVKCTQQICRLRHVSARQKMPDNSRREEKWIMLWSENLMSLSRLTRLLVAVISSFQVGRCNDWQVRLLPDFFAQVTRSFSRVLFYKEKSKMQRNCQVIPLIPKH